MLGHCIHKARGSSLQVAEMWDFSEGSRSLLTHTAEPGQAALLACYLRIQEQQPIPAPQI